MAMEGEKRGVFGLRKKPLFKPKHPFMWTTAALFLLFLFMPLSKGRIVTFFLIQLTFLDALLVGISAGGDKYRRLARFLVATWLMTAVLESASMVTDYEQWGHVFQLVAGFAFSVFIVSCLAVMLLYILRSGKISTECLFAAASAYLLMGFAFGIFYNAIMVVNPGAFIGLRGADTGVGGSQIVELIYFSLVTLTTLGYGDIAAISPFARMVTALEAVVGQLYMTLLVGWLIGTFVSNSMDKKRGAR